MRKYLFLLIIINSYFNQAIGQTSSDREAITSTVQLYFDGMIERDRSKLDQAFFSEARLIGFRGGELTITSYDTWATSTSKGEPRNPAQFKNELVSIRVQGNTAVAETELYWPGIYYYDFLTLLKIDGVWKIVHKSWSEKNL